MEIPLVEFRNVTKRFGRQTVLDGVDLKIFENQITTIIGKSGTGKSVLLKHIIGLLKPDEGTIFFRGKPVNEMKKKEWDGYRAKISYLFQNNALFDSMTVFENIALPLKQTTSLAVGQIGQKVRTRIEQTELAEVADKYPSELSGGMQKRVALARALVSDPEIVLFDEPTTGQDPIRKNAILSMIARYRKKFAFTAVLISHDIPDVMFISDRILLLWEGKVGFEGTYDELTKIGHPLIQEFLRSLQGFQDELTGLLSKEMFRSRYFLTLGEEKARVGSCAILFGIDMDDLEEELGPEAALEVMKSLATHVRSYFGPFGGFSVRHSRDQILTILPQRSCGDVARVVDSFSKILEREVLPGITPFARSGSNGRSCFDLYVYAGVTSETPDDDIDQVIANAASRKNVIATFRCDTGGDKE